MHLCIDTVVQLQGVHNLILDSSNTEKKLAFVRWHRKIRKQKIGRRRGSSFNLVFLLRQGINPFCCTSPDEFHSLEPWSNRICKDDTRMSDGKIGTHSNQEADRGRFPWSRNKYSPGISCITFFLGDKKALAITQDLLNKRWMTLDLLSILREAQRTLPLMQISFLKMNFISIIPSFIVTHFIYTKICLASQDFVTMNKSQRQVIYKWDWNTKYYFNHYRKLPYWTMF